MLKIHMLSLARPSTLLTLVAGLTFHSPAVHARASKTQGELGVFKVTDDPGGYVRDYAARVDKLRTEGRPVALQGECDSACTLYLTLPRRQTCITQGAEFRFHAPSGQSEAVNRKIQDWMMRHYPRWVQSWIEQRAGRLNAQLVTMSFNDARKFMRVCSNG